MVIDGARNANEPARLQVAGSGGTRVLIASGRWTLGGLAEVDAQIRELGRAGGGAARIDVAKLSRLDTAGAWLIHSVSVSLGRTGTPIPIEGASDNAHVLLDAVAKNAPSPLVPPRSEMPLLGLIERIGANLERGVQAGWDMLGFSGLIVDTVFRVFIGGARLRINATVRNIEAAGFNAVPIIALMSFLIGAVMSFMSGDILKDYGGQIFAVDFLSFAFLREFGVLLASIMVAGRSGSAFTAEIGAMKSHEEIDAMRSLALDPVEILVVPRVLALIVALPLLTFIANMAGLLGGALVDWTTLGITPPAFVSRLLEATDVDQFIVGMVKTPVFAFVIAMIGCFQGFKVTGTAESVGERTTLSVVQSIFTVIVFDALFALFFQEINY